MKRILSLLLAMCMVLGLMAGMAVTAFAEDEVETIAITGVTAPTAGGAVTTEGITGAPQGFTLSAQWEKYNYTDAYMEPYAEATFADDGVYRLRIELEAQGDSYLPNDRPYAMIVDGDDADDWWPNSENESGFTGFALEKVYFVGDITMIDTVTIEALPAEEAGASTDLSGIVLPEDAPYHLNASQWYRYDGEEVGSVLEADLQYTLWTLLVPEEGYWFCTDAALSAPQEASFFSVGSDGSANADFDYDLRPIVKEVELFLDMELAYGDPTADLALTVPAGANYTVSASWNPDSETLGYGEYRLVLNVTPAEGYTFSYDLDVTINGQRQYEAENWYIREYNEDRLVIEAWLEITPENGFVQDISLSGAPGDITAGEAITAPTLTVDRGEVTISKTEWVDANHGPVSGKFEAGKAYYLAITLTAAEGYALRSGYYAQVKTDEGYVHPYQEATPEGTAAVVYIRYSLQPTVDAIEITVTEPVVGAAPAEPKVPAGAKYSIEHYFWCDYTTGEEATKFEDKKGYYLEVVVALEEGYEIGEDVKLTVNGKEPYSYGYGTGSANLQEKFSFMTQIDRVDITMPEPTLGGTGSIESIQLPADAKYSLNPAYTHWYGYNSEFTGTFEKDRYELSLSLVTDEGCEFTEDAKLYINGVLCESFYPYNNGTEADAYYTVSFRDVISKVELPALPTVAVGDEPSEPELEAPEGANYTIFARWAQSTGNLSLEDCTGPFRNGTVYYLVLEVIPNAGYEFSEDTVITIGGKEFTGLTSTSTEYITVAKQYSFGMQVIDKIELTVDAPENGKTPGQITAPEGAGYEIDEITWAVGKDADMDDAKDMKKSDTFAYGNYYWAGGIIRTEEGYVLSEDLVITVNGQAIDMSMLEERFELVPVMSDIAVVLHGFGLLTEPVQDPEPDTNPVTPPADVPDTGDIAPVAVLAVIAILSMTTLAVIGKKKFA